MQAFETERGLKGAQVQAHRRAVTTSTPEVASRLQELFGQKLVALMVGSGDPKAVGRWAKGEREPHADTEAKLRHAYHVAELLLTKQRDATVRSWMVNMNPLLDDRAPALVIAENPDRVLQVARAFLEEE